jgi:hypothetical protein
MNIFLFLREGMLLALPEQLFISVVMGKRRWDSWIEGLGFGEKNSRGQGLKKQKRIPEWGEDSDIYKRMDSRTRGQCGGI